MLVNKARGFITMKMKKRMEVRAVKQNKKAVKKVRMMLSDKMMEQMRELHADREASEKELLESVEVPV
jgi:hypothetical protein